MKTFGWALLCGLLGVILGIGIPVGFTFAMAASDGLKPGGRGSAATATAILLPFTAIGGAVLGASFGAYRGRTGRWGMQKGFFGEKQDTYLQALKPDRLQLFDIQTSQLGREEKTEARRLYLQTGIDEYRKSLADRLIHSLPVLLLSLLLGPLIFVILVPLSVQFARTIRKMRDSLQIPLDHWKDEPNRSSLDLPLTLR